MDVRTQRLEHALALLSRQKETDRLAGAGELVELARLDEGAEALRPHLTALTADAHPQLRAAGLAGLCRLGDTQGLRATFERGARDSDAHVRREAIRALASLEDAATGPVLARALQDADAQVRFDAAVGLAGLHDGCGVDELLGALDDKVRRFAALGALSLLAEPRARAGAERILGRRLFISDFERTQAAGLLVRLGDGAGRAHLLKRLERRRADDRGLAMELCGEHRIVEATTVLRRALADPADLFRGTAARSLGLLGDLASIDALTALSRDPSVDLGFRCDAMEGLMFLRTPEALATLHALSAEGDPELRRAANDALDWLQRHPGTSP
jgi:HEAT repeat protein